eukprot:3470019-Pyramimonas_sp.AAC.1
MARVADARETQGGTRRTKPTQRMSAARSWETLFSCTGCLKLRPLYFGVVVAPPPAALCPSCVAICVA